MKSAEPNEQSGEVKDVILGRLPIRSVNIKNEYKTIKWTTELNK